MGGGFLQPGSGTGISLSGLLSVTETRFSTRSAFAVAEKLMAPAKSTKDKHRNFFIDLIYLAFESF